MHIFQHKYRETTENYYETKKNYLFIIIINFFIHKLKSKNPNLHNLDFSKDYAFSSKNKMTLIFLNLKDILTP